MAKEITLKMMRFADFYLESGNIYQSAKKAGYSENYSKTNAKKLLDNDKVQAYIKERLDSIQSQRIASIQEVMEYLTKGMRQELTEDVIVTEQVEMGVSEAKVIQKKISAKDSNKCAEMLAKRFGMFTDNHNINVVVPVFGGEDELQE